MQVHAARVRGVVYFALSRMFTMLFKPPLTWVITSSILFPPPDLVMIVMKRLKIDSDLGTASA